MRVLDFISLLLVVVGAVNWGLIGFFQYDLVSMIFGPASVITRIIFALVGIAGIYALSFFARDREPRDVR
ncbi:MAG: DUF378 domain-containing protein [Solirubrobacterales bacterium]